MDLKDRIKKAMPLASQLIRFGIVGISNTVVDFGLLNLLHFSLRVPLMYANTISFICAVFNSFVWNKYWTFKDKDAQNVGRQFIQFVIVSIVGLAINDGIIYLAFNYLGDLSPLELNLSKISASIASALWNFIAYKKLVFKLSSPQRIVGRKE